MAKKGNKGFEEGIAERISDRDTTGWKTIKGTLPVPIKLEYAGDAFEGYFEGTKVVTMEDQNTKMKKAIRSYQFREENGKKRSILGRLMLDACFDDLIAGFPGGMDEVVGLYIRIERVEDTKRTKGGGSTGNYLLFVRPLEENNEE